MFTPISVQVNRTNVNNTVPSGRIEFVLNALMKNGDEVVTPSMGLIKFGTTGIANVTLFANDDTGTTPAGPSAAYCVTEYLNGQSAVTYAVIVSHTATITDVAAVITSGSAVIQLSNAQAVASMVGYTLGTGWTGYFSSAPEVLSYNATNNTITVSANAIASGTTSLVLSGAVDLATLAQYSPTPAIIAYIPYVPGGANNDYLAWDATTQSWVSSAGAPGGVTMVVAGTDISVNNSNPALPVVSVPASTFDTYGAAAAAQTAAEAASDPSGSAAAALATALSELVNSVAAGDSSITVGGTTTHPTVTVTATGTAGTYGDASHTLVLTTNAKGQVTGVTVDSIAIAQNQVSGLVSALAAAVQLSGSTMTGPLILSGDPTQALGASTKQYVDAVAAGLSPKESVTVCSSSNVTLSGTQTIDGVAVSAGQRVLLIGQTTSSQNGIWLCETGAWQRPTDFASGSTQFGTFTFVDQGTTYTGSGFVLVGNSITVDTSAQTWTQFSGAGEIVAGTGLSKTGNTLSIAGLITAGSAGSVSQTLELTYNAQGQLTSITPVSIQITESQVTGLAASLAALVASVTAGDASITIGGTATNPTISIAATGSAGTYGDAAHSLQITTNAKGQVTGVTVNAISVAHTAISDWATALAAYFNVAVSSPANMSPLVYSTSASQYINSAVATPTVAAGAATVPTTCISAKIVNNAASALTVTLSTTNAVDGEVMVVRIYDYSAVAQTLTWVNTENGQITVPALTNGSTTIPLCVAFVYNGTASLWQCAGIA